MSFKRRGAKAQSTQSFSLEVPPPLVRLFGHENQQISNFVPELTWLISGTKCLK